MAIAGLYLTLVSLWFVTHNVFVRFDPSCTIFQRPNAQGLFDSHRFDHFRAESDSSFNIISDVNIPYDPNGPPEKKPKGLTGLTTLILLLVIIISPIPLLTFISETHSNRLTSTANLVKHTISAFTLVSLPIALLLGAILPFLKVRRSVKFFLIGVTSVLQVGLFLAFFDVYLFTAH